jgi:hypothetical protein
MRIQNTLRATQRESCWLTQGERILLADSQFGAFFYSSSDIMEARSVALSTFKMSRKLLKSRLKYGGSCSVLSYRRLEQHSQPS